MELVSHLPMHTVCPAYLTIRDSSILIFKHPVILQLYIVENVKWCTLFPH